MSDEWLDPDVQREALEEQIEQVFGPVFSEAERDHIAACLALAAAVQAVVGDYAGAHITTQLARRLHGTRPYSDTNDAGTMPYPDTNATGGRDDLDPDR
jgi:hypothetical protein